VGLERGQALTNVDRRPQLAIDTVDPGVEPSNLGDELGFERQSFRSERVHLGREACVDAIDLLIEDTDITPERMNLGCDDVLKCLLVRHHAAKRRSIQSRIR
jgi:hypothetical protein